MEIVFNFLKDLCVNNNREWFDINRAVYQQVKKEFELFTDNLIDQVSTFDPLIKGVSAKESTFRIFRDTRFSHDKTPYKTNMGAFIVPGGRKSVNAGYYIHVEPDNSFIAGGIYMPPSDKLLKIREAIYSNPQEYKNIIYQPTFKKTFGEVDGERLKSNPRGFSKDFQDLPLIKLKSFTVMKRISDKDIIKPNLMDSIIKDFKIMQPLNNYFNNILLG